MDLFFLQLYEIGNKNVKMLERLGGESILGEKTDYILLFTIWGVANFLSLYLICDRFMHLEKKKVKAQKMLVSVAIYLILLYLNAYAYISRIPQLYYAMHLLFYFKFFPTMLVCYKPKWNMPFLLFFYELLVATVGQNLDAILYCVGLTKRFGGVNTIRFEVFSAVVFATILVILLKCRRDKNLNVWFSNLAVGQCILYIMLLYGIGTLQAAMIYFQTEYRIFNYIFIGIVFITIIFIFQSIIVIERKNSLEEIMNLLNEQMASTTEQYNELIQKDHEVKKFRHDIKNLLIALRSLIAEGKNEKALAYMDDMQESLSNTTKKYETGNFMADAVLNSKDTKAAEYYTALQFDGFVPVDRVKDIDIVILLSNLLDNAIEACAKVPGNKVIRIDSILKKSTWVLMVQNPTITDAVIENNSVRTTKENKSLHGFGLKNIEQVAMKYDGFMHIECEEGIFKTRVTMNI